jgi:hypothetical protein
MIVDPASPRAHLLCVRSLVDLHCRAACPHLTRSAAGRMGWVGVTLCMWIAAQTRLSNRLNDPATRRETRGGLLLCVTPSIRTAYLTPSDDSETTRLTQANRTDSTRPTAAAHTPRRSSVVVSRIVVDRHLQPPHSLMSLSFKGE